MSSSPQPEQHNRPKHGGHHAKKASAVLSMPNLFRATELAYESSISKFATYLVEERNTETGDEMLMKSIKNSKCIALTLRYIIDQLKTLEHNNLPRIHYQTFSDNYSYIVFEKPHFNLQPISTLFDLLKHNESICKSIIYELCRTITFTHAFGVVHKDLRPNNIFIHYEKSTSKIRQVMLIDFGATKALQSDEKLAIMEQGSGFLTHYVRSADGQYPAPEILMDLRYDRQCDAWFLGILIYMILNGGNIPFIGSDDDEIQDNILHSSDNKFTILKQQINNHKNNIINDQWINISDDLFDIINGLLTKDAKKRYTIDYILWSNWIPKLNYNKIIKIIIKYWLRLYKIELNNDFIYEYTTIGNNIRQSEHSGDIKYCNKYKTVIHQFKLCNYNDDLQNAYIKSDCYVTISSNIWCKYNNNPLTIEYNIDFAKYDIYFGIICTNAYEKDISYYHFVGSDTNSLSISVRYGKAWHDSNDVGEMKRDEYLKETISYNQNGMCFV